MDRGLALFHSGTALLWGCGSHAFCSFSASVLLQGCPESLHSNAAIIRSGICGNNSFEPEVASPSKKVKDLVGGLVLLFIDYYWLKIIFMY